PHGEYLLDVATAEERSVIMNATFTVALTRDADGPPRGAGRNLLLARVGRSLFELVHHLIEVVARRVLHRRERLVGFEFLQPQSLADGQAVSLIELGGNP